MIQLSGEKKFPVSLEIVNMPSKKSSEDILYLQNFGKKISELRKKKGISQVDLAFEMETDKANIRKIEAGRANVTLLTMKKLAHFLSIDIKELF
ncbi:MAG: helix-turn-helix transcriptional regulator [Bacteroidetes bacterium]|nr:helix-turn-helix transcriptional regulator [Bacteroidota bacterium]